MPSGVSDYGSATWLSALFGVIARPTEYFIALCSGQPGGAMDGDMLAGLEPTDAGYARQRYGTGPDAWASNGPYLTNLSDVPFPLPTDDWGYLTHFALCSDSAGGQVFSWGEIQNPPFVNQGIAMLIPPGALVLGLHALDNTIVA